MLQTTVSGVKLLNFDHIDILNNLESDAKEAVKFCAEHSSEIVVVGSEGSACNDDDGDDGDDDDDGDYDD